MRPLAQWHRTLTNPSARKVFFTRGHRQTCVPGIWIGITIRIGISEKNTISLRAFQPQPRGEELRLASIIIVVQIDEESQDSLIVDIGDRVDVRSIFLTRTVPQHL